MKRFIKDVFFSREELTPLQIQQLYINADGDYNDYFEFPLQEGEGDYVYDSNPLSVDAYLIEGADWIPEDMQKYSYLDLKNEAGIIIKANNPLDYTFGKAYKTYTIEIIKSGKNNELLDNLFHKNLTKTLIYDAILKINEIEFVGKLYIHNLTERGAKGQFVAAAGTLWARLLDKNVKQDFEWSGYTHTLNEATFDLSDAGNLFDGEIRYDFIDRGFSQLNFDVLDYIFNSTEPNTNKKTQMDLYYQRVANTLTTMQALERHPAMRVRSVLQKIFEGYSIYQNMMSDEDFDKLYYLYCQDQSRNTEDWMVEAQASAEANQPKQTALFHPQSKLGNTVYFNFEEKGLFHDISTNLSENGTKYVIPEDGSYRFRGSVFFDEIRMNLSNAVDFNHLKLVVELYEYDDNDVFQEIIYTKEEFVSLDLSQYPNLYFYDETVNFDTGVRGLKKDHYIKLRVTYQFNETADGGVMVAFKTHQEDGNGDLEFGANNYSVQPWQGIGYGGEVPGYWAVPDMTVAELITDILKKFNAEFYFSEEKREVYFFNRFITIPKLFDLTERIVKDSIVTNEEPIKRNYVFEYEEDSNDEIGNLAMETVGTVQKPNYVIDNKSEDTLEIKLNESFSAKRTTSQLISGPGFLIAHSFIFMRQAAHNVTYEIPNFRTMTYEVSDYTTDFNQRMAFYWGSLSIHQYRLYKSAEDYVNKSAPPLFLNHNGESGENRVGLSFNDNLFEKYHDKNVTRLLEGNRIECDIVVDTQFLYSMYFLTGRDLRSLYAIRIDGFDGVYQIISLNLKHDNIFRCELVQVFIHPNEFSDENEQFDDEYYK